MSSISNGSKALKFAFGIDSPVFSNTLDVIRKFFKVEKTDFMSMGRTVKRHSATAIP
jgi:hypothetical protein